MTDLSKAIKGLENELIKAKYIRRVPDGKGGWNYIYKESGKKEKKEEKEKPKKKNVKRYDIEIPIGVEEDGHDDLMGQYVKVGNKVSKCISSQNRGDQFTLEDGTVLDFVYNDEDSDSLLGHWEVSQAYRSMMP